MHPISERMWLNAVPYFNVQLDFRLEMDAKTHLGE
jgi:hypothetical protein